jgi:hypothetical protein
MMEAEVLRLLNFNVLTEPSIVEGLKSVLRIMGLA